MPESDGKLVYPPGIRDITEDISTEELVRRLKDCSLAFQSMSQDDDNTAYIPLALRLASESFLEHNSRDIQLLVACCIADIFRVYAPEAPYKDPNQLKTIFEFFVQQLKGLEDMQNPSFKRYFYLLENLSCVKTFSICVEHEDNQQIICSLFQVMFSIISDKHSPKVKTFMLDMLSPLISEADAVSQELLDIILIQIVEPAKSHNQYSCDLAQDILRRTCTTIEPYIQGFINNALFLSKKTQSTVTHCLYELIYELNTICPNMLVVVLPQLEFKLKSNEEKERLEVTKVLARMFSDPGSLLAQHNQSLWSCFLGRYTDISIRVRTQCVQSSMRFLLNQPDLREDITEQLKHRQHDPEESVRFEVVSAIINTAKEDISSVNEDLLSFVKERTLDKKFTVRKEALHGLAKLYKELTSSPDLPASTLDSLSWIKNKILHAYYQTAIDDRLLVEKILYTCLVPYQSPMEIRMKKLYQLFVSIDDYAVNVRIQVKSILDIIQRDKSENRMKTVTTKVSILSKSLSDSNHAKDHISKFCTELESNLKLCNMLSVIFNGNMTCSEAEIKVMEILKTISISKQGQAYFLTIKQLLERIGLVLVDKEGIKYLISFVRDSLLGDGALEAEMSLCDSSSRGLELLHALSFVFPTAFQDEEIYSNLLNFLQTDDESAADVTLQILTLISHDLETKFPEIYSNLVPLLEKFVELGNVKQAKHAVYCIHAIVNDKEEFFGRILEKLEKHFTVESMYIRTALVSVGHIAFLCHDTFDRQFKDIIGKVVVKNLLMADKDLPRGGDAIWEPFDTLPDETKAKLEGMKMMVRWLMGLKTQTAPAYSTLRIFEKALLCEGDLMQRQHMAPKELSWMRLTAAKCLTKLCQEPNYVALLTPSQYRLIAAVISDRCCEVRELFIQKLHKSLMMLKLPLDFLAILALGGVEEKKEFKQQIKNHLVSNINKRRNYIKLNPMPSAKLRMYQPDNVVPYVVHLLAHASFFESYDDRPSLRKVKECLWMIMEPLTTKYEEYCFAFFKRIFENIKQTKDSEEPDDDALNFKIYAVCDLALIILMSKSASPTLKDFPVEPLLPSKYFSCVDKSYSNTKTYLPADIIAEAKLEGFEFDIFEAFNVNPKVKIPKSDVVPSDILTPSASGESIGENSQEANDASSIANSTTLSEASSSSVGVRSLRTRGRRRIARNSPSSMKSDTNSPMKALTDSPRSSTDLDKSKDQSFSESNTQNSEASSVSPNKITSKRAKTTPVMSYTRTRSTRHSVATTSTSSSVTESPFQVETIESRTDSDKDSEEQVQNGLSISATAADLLLNSDARLLIKDCNVFLNKDDVERYSSNTMTNSSETSKTMSELSSGQGDDSKSSSKHPSSKPTTISNERKKSRLNMKKDVSVSSPTLNKRKRETSSEKSSKKTKSNTSNSSSKQSTTPQKSSQKTASQKSSKQASVASRKSPKQATSNPKMLKQSTPVGKSSSNSTAKASRSKSSASISPVKSTRLSPQKHTKTSLVNGTRSGSKAAGKVSKDKPKEAKQSVLKKGKKVEGRQVTRRR